MPYRTAGIDVHKKMLAVVMPDVEVDGEYQFERRMFGSNPEQLRSLAGWLLAQEVEEVVMESTAQYWKPVWGHWSDIGSRYARNAKAHAVSRKCCIWRTRSPITGRGDAKGIFPMPNAW